MQCIPCFVDPIRHDGQALRSPTSQGTLSPESCKAANLPGPKPGRSASMQPVTANWTTHTRAESADLQATAISPVLQPLTPEIITSVLSWRPHSCAELCYKVICTASLYRYCGLTACCVEGHKVKLKAFIFPCPYYREKESQALWIYAKSRSPGGEGRFDTTYSLTSVGIEVNC